MNGRSRAHRLNVILSIAKDLCGEQREILRYAQDDTAAPLVLANTVPETPLFRSICFNRVKNTLQGYTVP